MYITVHLMNLRNDDKMESNQYVKTVRTAIKATTSMMLILRQKLDSECLLISERVIFLYIKE